MLLAHTSGDAGTIQPTAIDTRGATTTAASRLTHPAIHAAAAAAHSDRVQREYVGNSTSHSHISLSSARRSSAAHRANAATSTASASLLTSNVNICRNILQGTI